MSIETKHHAPIVYKVYEELKNHVGSSNSISAKDLADKFSISERALRDIIHTIRDSKELEKAIGCSERGYFVCTKEDARKSIERLFNQAFSTLKVARALEKKVGKNGQGKISLSDYYAMFYESLGEAE